MLSYYRNALTHVFLPEGFIGFALVSFGSQLAYREGVNVERLAEETLFISNIFRNEYIHPREMKTEQDFNRTLRQMIERKILDELKDASATKITADIRNDKMIHFYCSFLSPLVEAYWATMQYILTTRYERGEKNL
jgi:glycerol-3-phosphate O-acyltransferase